ncbi:MAG: nucleotidyltransferase domain-containing protein [Candidatus Omnitrophota bacterium]
MIQNKKALSVANTIAESLKPSKIILFGSQTNESPKPESDIDLLIVYDGDESKKETLRRIHNLFPHPDFSLDVFLLRSDEFQKQIGLHGTVGREAHRSGVTIYG